MAHHIDPSQASSLSALPLPAEERATTSEGRRTQEDEEEEEERALPLGERATTMRARGHLAGAAADAARRWAAHCILAERGGCCLLLFSLSARGGGESGFAGVQQREILRASALDSARVSRDQRKDEVESARSRRCWFFHRLMLVVGARPPLLALKR